jgi:outer membrane usher protein
VRAVDCALRLAFLGILIWSLACSASRAEQTAAQGKLEELLLQLDLNHQSLDETVLVLRDASGRLYISAEDLRRWRLRMPAQPPLISNGVSYYALSTLAPTSANFDAATQRLSLEFLPSAFEATRVEALPSGIRPIKPSLGAFFNYDLNLQNTAGEQQYAGLFEAGVFNAWGVGTTSALWQHNDITSGTVRLESTWTTDFPERMTSLRLGDSINQPGSWGRAVRFGGVQYGTNFSTQPGFVTLPLQSVAGEAVLPSTVDVYVNNALATQRQIPPGPFAIRDLPVITGSGEVRVVVRDVLGREQVITQPFYTGTTLLRKGLSDYSFETGAIRNNFGIASNDYGPGLAVGTYRYGWSDRFTSEVHGEWDPDVTDLGVSGAWLIPAIGIVTATVAGSHGHNQNGHLSGIGFERVTPRVSLRTRAQFASDGFQQIGATLTQPVPQRVVDGSISSTLGRFGSIAAGYAEQRFFDGTRVQVASMNYNTSLYRWGFLNFAVVRTLSEPRGWATSLTWTVPLGVRTSASLTRQTSTPGSNLWTARLQQSPPVGDGWGYALEASDDRSGRASAVYQNRIGIYSADVERLNGETNTRLDAQGGLALLGGAAFLSRPITDSFAIVKVPDIKDVRVYADNQEVGRTNADGKLLLPRLRPYDRNHISIEQLDLPLDAEIGGLSLDLAPYYRAGVVADFPVQRVRSAILELIQEDGTPVPTDAQVALLGTQRVFPVGFAGAVYVSGLSDQNRLRASWDARACEFALRLPPGADPQPDLGVVVCKEVKP